MSVCHNPEPTSCEVHYSEPLEYPLTFYYMDQAKMTVCAQRDLVGGAMDQFKAACLTQRHALMANHRLEVEFRLREYPPTVFTLPTDHVRITADGPKITATAVHSPPPSDPATVVGDLAAFSEALSALLGGAPLMFDHVLVKCTSKRRWTALFSMARKWLPNKVCKQLVWTPPQNSA